MSAVPTNVSTTFVSSGTNVEVGAGYGGDSGTGFHSNQPVRAERWDDTENTHFKDRLDSAEGDLRADGNVASYPKYPESPYVRYVQRPLSSGVLSADIKTYKPEDRSKMGVPLNPFWIRNDMWSMENEADIFMDAGPNWVVPRLGAHTTQSAQIKREAYIENEEQPQTSNAPATLHKGNMPPPVAAAAGTVTTAVSTANTSDMVMKDANPAKVGMDEEGTAPKESDIDAKRKRDPEPQNGPENDDRQQALSSTTAEMPTKKSKTKGRQSKKTSS